MAEQNNSELMNYSRKKHKSSMFIVLIISLAVGLLVGSISFFLSYNYMISDSSGEIVEDGFSANDMADQVQANLIGSEIDGVVKEISSDDNTIVFYNLKNNTTTSVTATADTKYPADVNFDAIKIGDIFTYIFDKDKHITELKDCKEKSDDSDTGVWEMEDVGLAVSSSASMLKFTDKAEKYKDQSFKYVDGLTTVRYKNEYSSLEKLSPLDYVKVIGYDNGKVNKVYSVTIEKSHGELQVLNINYVEDVVLEINGQEYSPGADDPRVLLTEGTYNVKISAKYCEPVTKEVVIDPDKPASVDLTQLMVKAGALDVNTNVSGCRIYINDQEYDQSETILLKYGTYTVKATKDGYNDATGEVTIDADNNYIDLDLDKKEKSGTVKITASPSNASIYIDDVEYGTGSIEKRVALGSYIVKAEADGYETDKKQINVTAEGQNINVNFDLQPSN